MAEIHVYTSGGEQAVHPEQRVVELLASGELLPSDLYWRDGMAEWQPLSQFHPSSPSFVPARRTEPLPELSGYVPAPAAAAPPRDPASRRPRRYHFRRYPEPLTTVLQIFLLLCIGIAGFRMAVEVGHYSLISTEVPGLNASVAKGGEDLFTNFREGIGGTGLILEGVAAGMNLALLISYLMWIYQAVINSRNFSSIVRFSPGWAVGCNFVPAINLYLPCAIMQEIWKVSRNPRTWHNDGASFLVGIWWMLWIVRIVLVQIPGLLALNARSHDDIINVALFHLILVATEFVFYGIFFAVITVIVQNQKRLVEAGRRKPSPAATTATPSPAP